MPTRTKPASAKGRKAATSPTRKKSQKKPEEEGAAEVQAGQAQKQVPEQEQEKEHKAEQPEAEKEPEVGEKRDAGAAAEDKTKETEEEPPVKKAKTEAEGEGAGEAQKEKPVEEEETKKDHPVEHMYETGIIERGHIYFFYRPKVELEEVHSVDDVQRFHILLVPRPPEFSQPSDETQATNEEEGKLGEMKVLEAGADAIPAAEATDEKKKPFRLLAVGKKSLPDPEAGGGKGKGRKGIFWAMVTTVGEDLKKLQEGLGEKEYETKTRGSRHQGPARLAARGAYAIVNTEARVPSDRETHLGYHLSHPTPENFGDVQKALGIHPASSFVLQIKNPLAPNTGGVRVGLPGSRRVKFPERIMKEVFGAGAEGGRRRESYGLRFASVERREMLDYEGAELLLIAARAGEEGLDKSLGEGRGEALKDTEESEGKKNSIDTVLKELAMESGKIPAQPLEGNWE